MAVGIARLGLGNGKGQPLEGLPSLHLGSRVSLIDSLLEPVLHFLMQPSDSGARAVSKTHALGKLSGVL